MRSARMGKGGLSDGASLPSFEVTRAKAGGAVVCLALIESQYVIPYPPAASEWLVRLTPHATALIVFGLIWPWITSVLIRSWWAVRTAVAHALKAVLTYFVVKADEIREERKHAHSNSPDSASPCADADNILEPDPGGALRDGQTDEMRGAGSGT